MQKADKSMLNITDKIESQLSQDVQTILDVCSKAADLYGFKIFLIGGIVRDLFLKKESFDIDITVEGNATDFCHKLADNKLCKILQVNSDLKTVKVQFPNNIEIDFASTRQEFYPRRGHLPVVVRIGCTLEEDVYRRDFTINSLAVSLNKKTFGNVVDYVGGIDDIKHKKLKVLHDNSFNEDPSRIIRGLKFAARFSFHRDEHTKELQEKYQNTQLHKDISWSRIKSEIKQSFSLENPKIFDMFLANNVEKLLYAQKPDVKGLEIKTLIDNHKTEIDFPWLVYLGCILNDKEIIEAFCFTRQEKKIFTDKDIILSANLSMINSNYDIYKFFEKRTLESVLIYYLLTKRKEALIYIEKLSKIRVELNGEELKEMGLTDGKQIGEMLDKILRKKLNGNVINKADEINFVKTQIK